MANFDNGYIKIFRRILDWEWYSDINTRIVFIHCLLKANWKDKKWKGMEVKRGAFVSSLRHLSREIGISERSLRTALAHLELTQEVTQSTFPKYSVFTVVHYDEYQSTDTVTDTVPDTKVTRKPTRNPRTDRQTTDTVPTTTEEYKNSKKKRRENPKPPHRGWIPYVYHDSEWLRAHDPRDGWRFTEIDGVGWAYQEKVEG
jgi:hypothetical protein